MEFFKLLRRESKDFDKQLLIAGVFAGIVNTLLIFILTSAANKLASGGKAHRELIMAIVCLITYWCMKGYLMKGVAIAVEEIVRNMRLRISEKIRNTDLASFEAMNRAALHNAVSTHTLNISRAASSIVSAGTSMVLLVCAVLIIYFLSPSAFLILVGSLAVVILLLFMNQGQILAALNAITHSENKFIRAFTDLLDGFKELKMSSAKNKDCFEGHLQPSAEESRKLRSDGQLVINQSILIGSSALFMTLGAVVFLLPILSPEAAPKLVRIATLVIFIFGPLSEVVAVYPMFTAAEASINEINRIENELDSIFENGQGDRFVSEQSSLSFENIRCDKITFAYRDEKGGSSFSLAPFDFELKKSEMVFLTGGNGSGKSTFLKVLAGLYPATNGGIFINGALVSPANLQAYRDLFSPIFSDYHLFDYACGVHDADPVKVNELLHMTDLHHKTSIENGKISTVNLSTGQRKRLALVLSLLENKPILLLDEWAAEQDPQFRRKFYHEILPQQKKEGKTIIAVSHDDDHYGVADRVLKMQYGKFIPA